MVRTQIQLTSEQARRLRTLASASGRSIADLVRDGVDVVLREHGGMSRGERMRRASRSRIVGAFKSGTSDLATRHDQHFAAAADRRR
ncbi:MAG: hypothetical protein A3G21_24715 [Acidobacteria bacterium RIFCSPLOWO2_12_FULL_66_21]|nr:MAG: hypothetical protein A3G21_24715 [Acidobacteria bacterium RIFCSPLOWO2_12_FULL_66_21]